MLLVSDVPPTSSSVVELTKSVGERLELVCNATTRPPAYLYWTFTPTVGFHRQHKSQWSKTSAVFVSGLGETHETLA